MKTRFVVFRVLKISLMITLFVNLIGFGTMYLWNWLVPVLFKGPVITFLQAIGILVLAKILFGGFRGFRGGRGYRWKQQIQERFANMTPEEKEKFRHKMQDRCGGKFEEFEQTNPVTE